MSVTEPVTDTPIPTFTSVDPTTGEALGEFPFHGDSDVLAAVDAARIAARWWADLGFTGRKRRLMAWKAVMARRAEQLATLVQREQGRPVDDALVEIILSIEHINYAAARAHKTLGERRVRPGLLTTNQAATLSYEPLGVIGVIGPWNYPVFTPIGSIAYALAAGNAVVYKPSEFAPAVGQWLVDTFAQVVPEQPVLSLITGDGTTGAALCRSGVDKLSFTGSATTARKVMAACAETLTPVLLECGGKDALLVDSDADLDKAAEAATFGAFGNAGQTCAAVERIYAVDSVYDEFLDKLSARVELLRSGTSYGPMTMPQAADVVRRHVDDALARGGRAVVGGPVPAGVRTVEPVVLVDVPEESIAVVEETFGPIVTVKRVRDIDEGVDLANASAYGLSASVFGKKRSMDAARRLRVGAVTVNAWVINAGVPALPWGGVGDSGFGRIHGEDGLREFTRPKAITRERFTSPIVLTTFDRKSHAIPVVLQLMQAIHGRRSWIQKP